MDAESVELERRLAERLELAYEREWVKPAPSGRTSAWLGVAREVLAMVERVGNAERAYIGLSPYQPRPLPLSAALGVEPKP